MLSIAIRNDLVSLSPGWVGYGLTGLVNAIEYRGGTVQMSLTIPGAEDFTVSVNEAAFYSLPHAVGSAVQVSWTPESLHILTS